MTPAAFKAARKALGMTQGQLARALKLADRRTIQHWEDGARAVSGPAEVAVTLMLERRGNDVGAATPRP